MIATQIEMTFIVDICCSCGVTYALESKHRAKLLETGNSFYCPNGHSQHFVESTAAELKETQRKLKNAIENEKWWKERAEEQAVAAKSAQHQSAYRKGQLKKLKGRIANGVCPCCHRQFENLHRHMEGQHPDYIQKDTREPS